MSGRRPSMFASLGIRNYRLYFSGQTISVAGSWMQNIAVGWLVLELTGSGTILGFVTAAKFVPLVVLGPWGGLVADRVDNRKLLLWTQVAQAVLTAVLAALVWAGAATVPLLVIVVFTIGLVNVLDGPSRQSLIPQLVQRELVGNAIALNSITLNLARIVGPAIGGVLIAHLGLTPCFVINALSFGPVIASLLLLRSSEIIPAKRQVSGKGQIRAGISYIRRTPALALPMIMVTVIGTLAWEFPVTLPLLTTTTFHQAASGYGTAMAFLAAGALGGGLVAARRHHISVRSLAYSSMLCGLTISAAGLAPSLTLTHVALMFVGASVTSFNSAAKTVMQLASAPEFRGRVMGLWQIAWQGSAVIGGPVVGWIGSTAGPRYALLTGGIAAAAVGLPMVARRTAR
ncbi:putative MFS family arabinose efflux permease [Asanoa ferruginea]|uniref:Putative MFS family arabinose efflux permease n=1 Tax=Asanoa ferruginea TaxID=53367 RepID=A0A3D9ZRD1_9ACTN|nr:putative MFS family arabinose efflux permease [Asanoa ferruginea]